jgi:hypothetical protein
MASRTLSRTLAASVAVVAAAGLSATATATAGTPSAAAAGPAQTIQHLSYRGSVNLGALAAAQPRARTATPPAVSIDAETDVAKKATSEPVPNPAPNRTVVRTHPGLRGFIGITEASQGLANGFDVEPPDQGLCAGQGFIFEQVNLGIAVYRQNGTQLTPVVPLNVLYGVPPLEDFSHNPPTFGTFLSDPRCQFDQQTKRWYVTVVQLDLDPYTGPFGSRSRILIAVSRSSNPTGSYGLFAIEGTDTGINGTPAHPGCPCFGDYPQIGANADAFVVTTQEFGIPGVGSGFNGSQVYAISKRLLAQAASAGLQGYPPVVHISAGTINGGPAFRLSPAIVPPGAAFTPDKEFFVSTANPVSHSARELGLWTLSGTSTLGDKHPALHLRRDLVPTQLYTDSGVAPQRSGPHPLGQSLKQPLGGIEAEGASVEAPVYLIGNKLAVVIPSGFGTKITPIGRGVEWFVLNATTHSLVRQGYARVAGTQLMFPAVALNPDGTGAVVMSAVGVHRFPSVV